MADIEVRRGRGSDKEKIIELFSENVNFDNSLPEMYKNLARESDKRIEDFKSKLDRIVWDERCPWIIGENKGDIVGCMRISTSFMDELDRPVGVVNELIVSEKRRRTGVGKYLISWAIEHFTERRMLGVMLDVPDDNKVALNFYLKAGFLTSKRKMVKFFTD
jgi:ribosomal protein S18 acetylase RimI-like enzyme